MGEKLKIFLSRYCLVDRAIEVQKMVRKIWGENKTRFLLKKPQHFLPTCSRKLTRVKKLMEITILPLYPPILTNSSLSPARFLPYYNFNHLSLLMSNFTATNSLFQYYSFNHVSPMCNIFLHYYNRFLHYLELLCSTEI